MIPVIPSNAPTRFDERCRIPGKLWLQANPKTDVHKNALWSEFREDLRSAFGGRCGFLAMRVPRGTIDHWISVHSKREKAYDWDNLRFVDGDVNSAKKPSWEGKLIDPFEVEEGWFEIELPSLRLAIANIKEPEKLARARFTLEKLHLEDGEDVIRMRREWLELYDEHSLDLDGLRKVAPLLARAVEKRQQSAK